MMLLPKKYVVCITLLVIQTGLAAAGSRIQNPLSRQLEVDNQSGETIQIDWIHPLTGEFVPYGTSDESGSTRISLQSFVNHTFALRLVQQQQCNGTNINLGDQNASTTATIKYIKVGDPQEQLIVVKKDLEVAVFNDLSASRKLTAAIDAKTASSAIIEKCKKEAELATLMAGSSHHKDTVVTDLVDCLTKETAAVLVVKNEVLAFERDVRRRIANQAENYTCADQSMITTKPFEQRTWSYGDEEPRQVGILHERPASKIHLISNFISANECEAIRLAAEPLLHRGTVADGKGGSRMSESRKAWQAGLETAKWDDPTDPIVAVKRRLFAYANSVTGFNMSLDGQEDIMSIQYFGNGTDDPTPDRYTPHCDGDCDSMPHKTGGRVATMVMYCDIPTVGGATNFQHANVYVKPTLHAGVFFSYMDNATRTHEEGFTTHSGCPVIEGTKRIAVQWMRVGVDLENPWDSLDTNTIKKGTATDE